MRREEKIELILKHLGIMDGNFQMKIGKNFTTVKERLTPT